MKNIIMFIPFAVFGLVFLISSEKKDTSLISNNVSETRKFYKTSEFYLKGYEGNNVTPI